MLAPAPGRAKQQGPAAQSRPACSTSPDATSRADSSSSCLSSLRFSSAQKIPPRSSPRPKAGGRNGFGWPSNRRAPFPVVQTSLKLSDHARQVPVHRRARGIRIARFDGFQDRGVIANRLVCQLVCVKVALHATPQLGALGPETFDYELERAVAGRFSNPEVKLAVARLANREVVDMRLHPREALPEHLQILLARLRGRQRRDLAFDELSRLQQLERPRAGVPCGRARRNHGRYEDARADANLDQPSHLERDDRLAHRCPAYSERCCELPLGRQTSARRKFSAGDQSRDLVCDLSIESPGFDCLQGQGWLPPCRRYPVGAGLARKVRGRFNTRWHLSFGLYCGQVVEPPDHETRTHGLHWRRRSAN